MTAIRLLAIPAFALGLSFAATGALAQGKGLKEQLVGTWTVVSYDAIAADGSRKPIFSPKPKGTLILAANGRYAMMIVDPDRPQKWSAKSREGANVEELASAARGLVAQFGEWSVDEAAKMLIRKNEGALNRPPWDAISA
jgi:Lipocalin-like domain